MYKVYIHIFPNNKKYVGITSKPLQERWCDGKGYSGFVRKAIDKYGWENIKHFVYKQGLTEEQAKLKEKELIAKYKTMDPRYGYNLTSGGDGTVGFHQPEHVKRAVAEANSKRTWSKESRQKASQSKIGKNSLKSTNAKLVNQGRVNQELNTQKRCDKECPSSLRETIYTRTQRQDFSSLERQKRVIV